MCEIGAGFGSRQRGASCSQYCLSRCLHGLLNPPLTKDLQLDLRSAAGIATPASMESFELKLEVVVVVHQNLLDVIAPWFRRGGCFVKISMIRANLAGGGLVDQTSFLLISTYLEDDLVISDPLFVDKILWMAERSNHQCVLLPHRYELTRRLDLPPRLLIDGAIDQDVMESWHRPYAGIATGTYRGQEGLIFDCPSNPHSGCFGISRQQLVVLREKQLPRHGFVGPLETAATYTVGCVFLLLKPALVNRQFLMVEHAHPSYLGYLNPDRL